MLKKLILPLAMLVLVGCSAKKYDWVVKIDNHTIDPDSFVSAQMQSYLEAQTLAEDGSDVLGSTIDGVNGSRWINQNTIDTLKRNIFVENEFENRNLKFNSDVERFIKSFAQEGWESVSVVYKNNGLDVEYYMDYLISLYKEQLVFNSIFLSGDENAVTDREIQQYLQDNLCRVSVFKVAKINDDGSPLTEDQKPQLASLVADATDRISGGESVDKVAGDILTQAGVLLGSTADFSNGGDFVTTAFVSSSSSYLAYDFLEEFFHKPQGTCLAYEMDDCYYICRQLPLCETQVEYAYLKQDVANLLRDVEFEEMIRQAGEKMTVEINDEAMAYYTPSRLDMTID